MAKPHHKEPVIDDDELLAIIDDLEGGHLKSADYRQEEPHMRLYLASLGSSGNAY